MDLGLNSWDFYLGFGIRSSKPPIEVLWCVLGKFHVGFEEWL